MLACVVWALEDQVCLIILELRVEYHFIWEVVIHLALPDFLEQVVLSINIEALCLLCLSFLDGILVDKELATHMEEVNALLIVSLQSYP